MVLSLILILIFRPSLTHFHGILGYMRVLQRLSPADFGTRLPGPVKLRLNKQQIKIGCKKTNKTKGARFILEQSI